MRVLKPAKPSYILAGTHGWHMSIPKFEYMEGPREDVQYLTLEIDMRGRAFSDGNPDCNGWELYDVIDAINYAREHYSEYIIDRELVYFEGGSGGGGNAYSIVGKFPDFFAAATALCGITDYGMWYEDDQVGEFRDELDIWIGGTPRDNSMAYISRSGLYLLENLQTPLFIVHGETDIRVPAQHARNYVDRAIELGKDDLIEYMEMGGIGGEKDHWANATEEQMIMVKDLSEQNRVRNRTPIEIPDKGEMVVAGYLYTKKFSVILDSIDKVAILQYDLDRDAFKITSPVDIEYQLEKFY